MAGGGYYNAHSPQQAEIAAASLDAVRRAAEAVPASVTAGTIVDYGSSQGRNSVEPLRAIIAGLRAHRPGTPLTVVHTDLPSNDWTTLFETAFGAQGYLRDARDVFPMAIGRSFYERLLPDASVAMGWSGTAVLWLSRRPEVGPRNLFSSLASGTDAERWAAAAAADWETFLRHRSRELAPGGRLVVSSLMDSSVYPPYLAFLRDAVDRAADLGCITADEAAAMTVPTYLRTREEIEAPLADGALGLAVAAHDAFVAPDPAFAAYRRHGDRVRFGADAIAQLRGWAEPSLLAALAPGRSEAERAEAGRRLFASLQSAYATDPGAGHCDWSMSLLTVVRPV
jgi:hypothetical protein